MESHSPEDRERNKTKLWAWTATILYLILVPVSFMIAGVTVMKFNSPTITPSIGILLIFMYACVPLSIPVTLYLVWSRFSQKRYKKSRQYCFVPLYVTAILIAFDFLIHL